VDLARAILDGWTRLGSAEPPPFLWPAPGDRIRWEGGEGTCLGWEPDGRLRVDTGDRVLSLTGGDVRALAPGGG